MNHFNVENMEFVMMKRFQCEKELPRKQLLPHKSKNSVNIHEYLRRKNKFVSELIINDFLKIDFHSNYESEKLNILKKRAQMKLKKKNIGSIEF